MLKILQIEKIQDFYQYDVTEMGDEVQEVTVITPNPQLADQVRKKYDSFSKNIETVTISAFIKSELNALDCPEVLENYRGKSELTLLLGAIWKKIGRELDIVKFKKAFNLLTEFRSFSLSDQVLETVLEHYDSELKDNVLWLNRFLDQLEIIDEHKSYFFLSEKLREGEISVEYKHDRKLVFFGFDFFTASQVDLLKSLSLRNDVLIPIYKEVHLKAKSIDWVNWLDGHNTEVIDISKDRKSISSLDCITYSKGYLGKSLKNLEGDDYQLALASKTLERQYIQEIPLNQYQSKVAVNIFEDDFEQISLELEKLFLKGSIEVSIVRDEIVKNINQAIQSRFFQKIKCYLVYQAKINAWAALSEENTDITAFDFNILKEAAELDLPRTNHISLHKDNHTRIISLKEIDEFKEKKVKFILNSNYHGLSTSGVRYTENVEKYLASIGPLRTVEYENNVFKSKLKEFLEDNEVSLLIEEGMFEQDQGWNDVFAEYELNYLTSKMSYLPNNYVFKTSAEKYQVDKISSSKLQRYIDCPQKFYQHYMAKINPRVELNSELSVLDLGQIEHKVIEKYFEKNNQFELEKHHLLINQLLSLFMKEKQISSHVRQEYFVEVQTYTEKIIKTLFTMKEQLQLDHSFEFEFHNVRNSIEFNGSIDCLLSGANGKRKIILDFKRSNSSFTSYKSIVEFEQIQLWFYLKRLLDEKLVDPNGEIAIGYIDLSNFENSMLFSNDEDLLYVLKSSFGFKKNQLIDDLPEHIKTYSDFEDSQIAMLQKESAFQPMPRTSKVCHFCPINKICSKEAYDGHC